MLFDLIGRISSDIKSATAAESQSFASVSYNLEEEGVVALARDYPAL